MPPEPRKRRTRAQIDADNASKAQRRDRYVERTYKISAEMYRLLLEFQGGLCWGCGRATGEAKELAVDHNHRTGEVRMCLCGPDNQMVGRFRDNPVALIRLGLALISPPSRAAWTAPGHCEPGWGTDDPEFWHWFDVDRAEDV